MYKEQLFELQSTFIPPPLRNYSVINNTIKKIQ